MTVHRNPGYVLDIIKGSFKDGSALPVLLLSDSDVIRVTGYLVKRSELEKLAGSEAVLQDTTATGTWRRKQPHSGKKGALNESSGKQDHPIQQCGWSGNRQPSFAGLLGCKYCHNPENQKAVRAVRRGSLCEAVSGGCAVCRRGWKSSV